MFDKIKKIVSKEKPSKPLAWINDLEMQARLAKKEGITEPLSITIEEVEDLVKYQKIVMASQELWEYHKGDLDWMKDEHASHFKETMKDFYGSDE